MIKNIVAQSGKKYELGKLEHGVHQYMDRAYQFEYIAEGMQGSPHIKTHGNDKMLPETEVCFSFTCDRPIDAYVLYPDKQPVLPRWLAEYERVRMNVTRFDSMPTNLKGYFSLYRKHFEPGTATFYGNSPLSMLAQDWYVETNGANYCMYTVAVREK